MQRVGGKRDQQSRFTLQAEDCWARARAVILIMKIKRAAAEGTGTQFIRRVIQKHDDGNAANSQMIEFKLLGVAILVTNKKIALLIAKKLGLLTIRQLLLEMNLQRRLLLQQQMVDP